MTQQNKSSLKKFILKLIDNNSGQVNSTTRKKLCALKEKIEDNRNCNGNKKSSPSYPNLYNVSSTSETAFQRAIYKSKYSILDFKDNRAGKKIKWLDLELPITLTEKSRRPCVDLIGKIKNIPIICELKFYKKKSNSDKPLYALIEVLAYYYFILCNYDRLDKFNIHHKNTQSFKWEDIVKPDIILLMIAANKSYWNYWLKVRRDSDKTKQLIKNILSSSKKLGIDIKLFSTPEVDFDLQKGSSKYYAPKITPGKSKSWSLIKLD